MRLMRTFQNVLVLACLSLSSGDGVMSCYYAIIPSVVNAQEGGPGDVSGIFLVLMRRNRAPSCCPHQEEILWLFREFPSWGGSNVCPSS